MRIIQNEIPIKLRRKAAQFLESIRGTEMAVGAENAELGDKVCPIFRPDLEDVAYYEFDVQKSAAGTSKGEDTHGFIIVSTADHDHPIAHWSLERPPVSVRLENEAERDRKKVNRVFKLDTLSYIGEDKNGKKVAQEGQMPDLMISSRKDLEEYRGQITSTIATPLGDSTEDERGSKVKHSIEMQGPKPPEFAPPEEPPDWGTYKKEYGKAFHPLLEDLKRNAGQPWKIDRLVEEFGEGIMEGSPQRVALLYREAAVKINGDAAEVVKMRKITRKNGPSAVELFFEKNPFKQETSFELHIKYENGLEEQLDFFVVSKNIPSKNYTSVNSKEVQ